MRLAAISDIHGDLAALRRVWSDLEARGLAATAVVLNAGDLVAYGPDTMGCIDFAREPARRIVSVAGNYDVNVSRYPDKEALYRQKWGKARPAKLAAISAASDALTPPARRWLAKLPHQEIVEVDAVGISVTHYAPTEEREGLFYATPQSHLARIAAGLSSAIGVVVTGHTHSAFVRRAGAVLFVNPGSVGRSLGVPTYAEIVIEPGALPAARIIACHPSPR